MILAARKAKSRESPQGKGWFAFYRRAFNILSHGPGQNHSTSICCWAARRGPITLTDPRTESEDSYGGRGGMRGEEGDGGSEQVFMTSHTSMVEINDNG